MQQHPSSALPGQGPEPETRSERQVQRPSEGGPGKGIPAPWRWTDPATGEELDSEQLIKNNLKLARKYAWSWARKSQMAYDDLEAIAFVGLVKGCRKFNPASGYKLSTIAVPYINGEILHHFRDRGYAVKFPARWREVMPRARRLLEAGESPEVVCEAIGVDSGELEEMLGAMAGTVELDDELVGEVEAQVEADVLEPVARLVNLAWSRLHPADRQALEAFWDRPGRSALPTQALGQFLNAARRSLAGQRLPEIRRQLLLTPAMQELAITQNTATRRPRKRSRAEIETQAAQMGLMEGLD